MKKHQSDHSSGFVLATIAALLPAMAMAQTYPSKPIRIVVGFSAGGSVDTLVRIAGSKLRAELGQSVIVDNRPGAGGNIAAELVAKSPADGYTLLATPSSFAVNPSLYRKVPYDAINDFEPVTAIASYMLFLVSHPSLPVRSVKELIALAKAKPGYLNYCSSGVGTTTHIGAELFSYMAGVKLTHIPYKGNCALVPAVLSGEVPLAFSSGAAPLLRARKLILLAVTGAQRHPDFPDAPTIAEAGVPGYEVTSWNALFAPAGTPAAIVKRISEEVGKGLRQADALDYFEKQGFQQATGTPEALGALVAAELVKWAKVIKAAGIPLQ